MKIFNIYLMLMVTTILYESKRQVEAIKGGILAASGEFPYQVSIRDERKVHICGGAIIDSIHILTAAHCVCQIGLTSDVLTILSGTNNRTNSVEIQDVANITCHENYYKIDKSAENDIAIIRVAAPIVFNRLQKSIILPIKDVPNDVRGIFAGWGYANSSKSNKNQPIRLRKLSMSIIDTKQCQTFDSPDVKINPHHHLCASGGKGKGATNGDSGGALIYNHTIVGIACRKVKLNDTIDVFTRVYNFSPWINRIIKNDISRLADGRSSYQVSIFHFANKTREALCSGVIMQDKYILTSAECIIKMKKFPDLIKVSVGMNNESQQGYLYSGEVQNVSEIHVHEDYEENSKINNVAILKLAEQMILFGLKNRIDLADRNALEHSKVEVSGWSNIDAFGHKSLPNLKMFKMNILPDEKCKAAYGDEFNYEHMYCVERGNKFQNIIINSGSPFVYKDELIGIASSSINASNKNPIFFTRVNKYKDWIESKLFDYFLL